MTSNQTISTTEFQEFLSSCRSYCDLLELQGKIETTDFLINVQKLLLQLYSNAMNLKAVDLTSDKDCRVRLKDTEVKLVEELTVERLGVYQFYWLVFDPIENEMDKELPVCGDLLDDLVDVYKDIKRQLLVLSLNTVDSAESAVWTMRFDFWNHWSNHAIDAIRAIHYMLEKTGKYR